MSKPGSSNQFLTCTLLFAAGFALWALTSVLPLSSAMHEGWDRGPYWQIGVPLLFGVQAIAGAIAKEPAWRQPLWVLLGHLTGMMLVHRSGTGLTLLPLTIVFIGVPAYIGLYLAAFVGRVAGRLR
jgi:hypothetical protein